MLHVSHNIDLVEIHLKNRIKKLNISNILISFLENNEKELWKLSKNLKADSWNTKLLS